MTDQPAGHRFSTASPIAAGTHDVPSFAFWGGERPMVMRGIARELTRGALPTLAERVAAFFAAHRDADRLVGAVPFDRNGEDYLFQPAWFGEAGIVGADPRPARATITAEPPPEGYARAVEQALVALAGPDISKVVLSRSLLVSAQERLDPVALAARLAEDPSVVTFIASLPRPETGPARHLVGATPELLVRKRGAQVLSHPLAGSARRSPDPARDAEAIAALERSDKDRREHAAVVEAILDILSPLCASLDVPDGPSRRATASMWHLGTPIRGVLKDSDTPVGELVNLLHPTPAVCGLPRERANGLITELETYDRDFYAGAVGTIERSGDGEWYVSIRCADVSGETARLYAGAGIVLGSDPQAEVRETSAKFVAMLNAFGLEEEQD